MDERSLIEYVTRQRWYGAKSRTVSHSEVLDTVTSGRSSRSCRSRSSRCATTPERTTSTSCSLGRRRGRPVDGLAEDAGIARELVSAMRAGLTLQGSEGVAEFTPGRGLLRAGPRARRGAARLLRAVEHLGRLRRRADPQGLPPARARDQPGARDAALPHRARLPEHPRARRLVRVLGRAAHRHARAPAGVRRRRDRRLGARARRDRVRARELPRPARTARRGDRAHAHRARRRRRTTPRSRPRSRASSRSGC